jgi:hypothetical protein
MVRNLSSLQEKLTSRSNFETNSGIANLAKSPRNFNLPIDARIVLIAIFYIAKVVWDTGVAKHNRESTCEN